jgi:hypothetical protein
MRCRSCILAGAVSNHNAIGNKHALTKHGARAAFATTKTTNRVNLPAEYTAQVTVQPVRNSVRQYKNARGQFVGASAIVLSETTDQQRAKRVTRDALAQRPSAA